MEKQKHEIELILMIQIEWKVYVIMSVEMRFDILGGCACVTVDEFVAATCFLSENRNGKNGRKYVTLFTKIQRDFEWGGCVAPERTFVFVTFLTKIAPRFNFFAFVSSLLFFFVIVRSTYYEWMK